MSRDKKDPYDWCRNHSKRPMDILYKGVPYCMECFDKIIEKENKPMLDEIKKRNEEKKKQPQKEEPTKSESKDLWW